MLFPYADENPVERAPILTIALICINTLIFLLLIGSNHEQVFYNFGFTPGRFSVLNLFTGMFLHSGIFHLVFNMWFLWLFGANVEDKLGRLFFLGFYLAGGVFAFLVYAAFISEQTALIPCVGASGAVSAVMGAYLVFFPRVKFRALFGFFVFFRRVTISAFLWLGIWLAGQLISRYASDLSMVAYDAHLGGFFFGVLCAFFVIKLAPEVKLKKAKEEKDIQEREHLEETVSESLAQQSQQEDTSREYREKIENYLKQNNFGSAMDLYAEFEQKSISGALNLVDQKRMAELFLEKGQKYLGFEALMRLVVNYQDKPEAAEAECKIGIICSRDLNNPSEAISYLKKGLAQKNKIADSRLIKEAKKELEVINQKLNMTFVKLKEQDLSGLEFAIVPQLIREDILDKDKIFRDLFKIGEVAGKNLGYKLAYNAEHNLKTKDGIILQKLNSFEATLATHRLQKMNIPVLAVPQKELLSYSLPVEIGNFNFSNGLLSLSQSSQNKEVTLKGSDINYVIMGEIPNFSYKKKEEQVGLFHFDIRRSGESEKIAHLKSVNRLIDIFTTEARRFRISQLATVPQRELRASGQEDFSTFAIKLAKFAGGERLDEKMKVFVSSNLWQGLVFKNIKEFNERALWVIRLKHAYTYLS